jgi:hypothetical protein
VSNTYFDATGVLLFDGPAEITPMIRTLFQPFNLSDDSTDDETQLTITVQSEIQTPFWDSYLEHLVDSLPEEARKALFVLESPDCILSEYGHQFGVDLGDFVDAIDFESEVNILDIVRLAHLLSDGHNLVGVSMEGAWHCDRPLLWKFGGRVLHHTPRYTLSLSSFDVRTFASSLDTAISASADATAGILNQWLNRFIDGIEDRNLQDSLRFRYVLPDKIGASSASADDDWSRTLYVGAIATDDGGGPEWARFQVTPAFIRRLKVLRAACQMHQVAEIATVAAPDAWGAGAGWRGMPLAAPRLVVTGDSFWFTAQPHRRVCSFETLPLSIHWLIDAVTGEGEPLYRRIDAEAVKD